MREIIAEQAAKGSPSSGPALTHYVALAVLAAAALIVLAIVMSIERALKRRR